MVDALDTSWQEALDISDCGHVGLEEVGLGSYCVSYQSVTRNQGGG